MAVTLNNLYPDTLNRLEEPTPPIFYNLTGEVFPQMVDAMFEAALATGVVQMSNVSIALAAGTTYFWGLPAGAIAPLRMRGPYPIRKVSLKGLDDMNPTWQTEDAGPMVRSWFPLGVSGFGIYPQLTADVTVTMDFIASPLNKSRPYDGTEVVPFQQEFVDFLPEYAAATLRTKEMGVEAEEAGSVFEQYMQVMRDLSLFQGRLDDLLRTSTYGGKVQTNPRNVV